MRGSLKLKPKRAPRQAGDAQWNQRVKLVEEFASLDSEVQAFKPRMFRHAKLRELILAWYPDVPAEDEILAPGKSCDILISAKDKIRSVTEDGKQALYRLWGEEQFIAKATILLKHLPDPSDEEGLYSKSALTGPRHLTVVVAKRELAANSTVPRRGRG